MATNYGIGIAAITDRPDPEVRVSGLLHVGHRLARRLFTPNGALLAIGDDAPYETLNLRDWIGARPTAAEVEQLNTAMAGILSADEAVETVTAAATFVGGLLSVAVEGTGAEGPFAFVITADAVTGAQIRGL